MNSFTGLLTLQMDSLTPKCCTLQILDIQEELRMASLKSFLFAKLKQVGIVALKDSEKVTLVI
jgi:hypothetical protein